MLLSTGNELLGFLRAQRCVLSKADAVRLVHWLDFDGDGAVTPADLKMALTPRHRVTRSMLLARQPVLGQSVAAGWGPQEGALPGSVGGTLTSEAASALAFVLEGELDAAWQHKRRQQLLLQHLDFKPEEAFQLLDKDATGIVSKGRLLELLRQHKQPASAELVESFFWRYDRRAASRMGTTTPPFSHGLQLLRLLLLPRRDRDGYLSLTDFLSLLYPRRRANKVWAARFKPHHSLQLQQQQRQQQHQQQQQQQEQQQRQEQQQQQQQEAEEVDLSGELGWASCPAQPSCSHDELAAVASPQLATTSSQLAKLSPRLHTRLPRAEETILQLKWERKRRQRDGRRALVADKNCCCAAESLRSMLGDVSQGREASCCLPSALFLPLCLKRLSPQALAAALEMILAISREAEAARRDLAYSKGFNLHAAWRLLDTKGLGFVTDSDLKTFVEGLGFGADWRAIRKAVQRYERGEQLSFSSFCCMVLPADWAISDMLRLQTPNPQLELHTKTLYLLGEVFSLTEAKLQGLRLLFREVDVFAACQQIRVYGPPSAAAAAAAGPASFKMNE
ncbi:hypothetical protein Esti_004526 [Eimeria stiedai]